MSLFENSDYRWRETCFVLMSSESRPQLDAMREQLGKVFEVDSAVANDDGSLVSMTLYSPNDFSAMDICYVDGEEVIEQLEDLLKDLKQDAEEDTLSQLPRIAQCNARLDVLHFERMMEPAGTDEEFLDPGSLLLVLEQLAKICNGYGVDPQSGTIL